MGCNSTKPRITEPTIVDTGNGNGNSNSNQLVAKTTKIERIPFEHVDFESERIHNFKIEIGSDLFQYQERF